MVIVPRTALERAGCVPAVHGEAIKFDPGNPFSREMHRPLASLHVGVRALLAGREWFGCSRETGWSQPFNPGERIPTWVGLHCVEGDSTWQIVERKPAEFWAEAPEPKRIANPRKYAQTPKAVVA